MGHNALGLRIVPHDMHHDTWVTMQCISRYDSIHDTMCMRRAKVPQQEL